MKSYKWLWPIFFIIFIAALLFENASINRLALLVVLGLGYFAIELIKNKLHSYHWLLLLVQVGIVFSLELESRFIVNYLFHLLYFLVIISLTTVKETWKKGLLVAIIVITSGYKFMYLLTLESNYENYSQSLFMMLVTVLLIVVVILYDQLLKEKEKTEKLIIELSDKHQQLEAFSREVERFSKLKERTTLARDLHDSVGHTLTGLIMTLEMTSIAFKKSNEDGTKQLESGKTMAREALRNLREAVDTLHQDTYSYDALKGMISTFGNSLSVIIQQNITREYDQLMSKERATLFRVIQECLTNSVKHGGATRISIDIDISDENVSFRVVDNGSGIDIDTLKKGNGLSGMTDRVLECSGEIRFISENGFSVEGNIRREQ